MVSKTNRRQNQHLPNNFGNSDMVCTVLYSRYVTYLGIYIYGSTTEKPKPICFSHAYINIGDTQMELEYIDQLCDPRFQYLGFTMTNTGAR